MASQELIDLIVRPETFRYAFRGVSAHCRDDPHWRARIAELERGLSEADRQAAIARANELQKAGLGP